jgi:hypothetical protein
VNRTAVGPWETFHLIPAFTDSKGETVYHIGTGDNKHFVTAINGGGGAVTTDRTSAGIWEEFRLR